MNTNTKIAATSAMALSMLITSILPSFAQNNFANRHPRRAEVLRRDGNINRRINADRGDLSGHYGQLKAEDRAVRRQEQREARQNGGYITKGEQRQLNREENHINNQIKRDQR